MMAATESEIIYYWSEAAVPPPHHYEYEVRIQGDGRGEIRFWPDYPGGETPCWQISFSVAAEDVQGLFRLMRTRGLFTTPWRAAEEPPVGGSSEWITVRAEGRVVEVPACLPPEQQEAMSRIYQAVRGLVPVAIWTELEKRRRAYTRF
ncbi:MAG: hypothetical protein D6775_05500 [Caldilineae bacterium]|nr:MAG: hypothetical protein D6775_05500 [Caldilineae bacterium]